jgi:hypothetical protein
VHLILAAILLLATPGARPEIYPMPLTQVEAEAMVDSLGREYIEMKAALQPHWATAMGIPGHDGDLARYTQRGVSRRLRKVFGIKRNLGRFVADSLSISAWVDHQVLLADIQTLEYWFSGQVTWRRSPLPYTDAIMEGVVNLILSGEEDSLSVHLASRLRAIPDLAADARTNITDPIKLHCEVAAADLRAFLPFLDTESLKTDPAIDMNVVTPEIVAGARRSIEAFAAYIDSLAAGGELEFALGAEEYGGYLKTAYMLEEPLYDLIAGARRTLDQANSKRNYYRHSSGMSSFQHVDVDVLFTRSGPISEGIETAITEYKAGMMSALKLIEILDLLRLTHADSLIEVEACAALMPVFEGALYRPPGAAGRDPAGDAPVGTVYLSLSAAEGGLAREVRTPRWAEPLPSPYPALHPAEVRLLMNPSTVRRYIRCDMGRDGWDLYFSGAIAKPTPVDGDEQKAKWADVAYCSAWLIAEISIHTGEFTLEEAADFIAGETGRPHDLALQDARRYAVAPGSGIGYLIGRREILRLRERYKKAKRNSFDLREFHDTLLSCGYLPPYLLSIEVMSKGMGRE